MEITEINMLGDFHSGIKCLQNPSLISRFSPFPQLYSFCKLGSMFLALLTTFTTLLRKIKLLTIRWINSWVFPSQPLFNQLLVADDSDFDFSDDDDDDKVSSSGSGSGSVSDDDEDKDIDYSYTSRFEGCNQNYNRNQNQNEVDSSVAGFSSFSEIHGQNGNCGLRQRNGFSWSDFSAGKSVVKLWDSFGFALDFEEDYTNEEKDVVLTWNDSGNSGGNVIKSNIFGGKCDIPEGLKSSSPAVILSAELKDNNCIILGAYDTRMGRCETPAIYAEWQPRRRKVAGNVNGATIGDIRNVKAPLEN